MDECVTVDRSGCKMAVWATTLPKLTPEWRFGLTVPGIGYVRNKQLCGAELESALANM